MRELKFRAWDGKKMHCLDYPWNDHWYNSEKGGRASMDNTNTPCMRLYQSGLLKVMQYTGLKDSEGKEIYHKDIIKCLPSGLYGVVEWLEDLGTFTLQIGNQYDTTVYSKQIDGKNIMREVVGNVYENPELI